MTPARALLARLRREDGLSLIEMLVGMATGIVVSLAAFALVDTSLHLYSQATDRLDSAQTGQSAMSSIEQVLESACVGYSGSSGSSTGLDPTPIQVANATEGIATGSDNTHLVTLSSPGDNNNPGSTSQLQLHVITLSSQTNGTLTDAIYPVSSYSPLKFSSTATVTRTLATGVSEVPATSGGYTPIFQYYGYTGAEVLSTTPFSANPLASSDANNTVEAQITFTVAPSSGSSKSTRQAIEQDAVIFRLSSSSTNNAPCT